MNGDSNSVRSIGPPARTNSRTPSERMMNGSPIASAHHFAPMRHLNICPTQVRRLPPEAQMTIAAPIGGPNPPNPIRIECVQEASIPEYASAPWIVQVNAYAIATKLRRRCWLTHVRMLDIPLIVDTSQLTVRPDPEFSALHSSQFDSNPRVCLTPFSSP